MTKDMRRGLTWIELLAIIALVAVVLALAAIGLRSCRAPKEKRALAAYSQVENIPAIMASQELARTEARIKDAGLPAPGPMLDGVGARFHTQEYRGHWYVVLGNDAFIHDPDCPRCIALPLPPEHESASGPKQ